MTILIVVIIARADVEIRNGSNSGGRCSDRSRNVEVVGVVVAAAAAVVVAYYIRRTICKCVYVCMYNCISLLNSEVIYALFYC